MGEFVVLPGTKLNPENLLRSTLESVGKLRSIIIIAETNDGTVDCEWSEQTLGDVAIGHRVLGAQIDDAIFGNSTDIIEVAGEE